MKKLHTRITPARIVSAVFCFLIFAGLEAAAIYFDEFSWISLGVMSLLCLLSVTLCLFRFRLPWPIGLLIGLAAPTVSFYLMESLTHIVWDTMELDAIVLNLIFYYLLLLFLYFLTDRFHLALIIQIIFVMFCGVANYFVILFRSTPILPWDFLSLGTAMSVANNYTFSIDNLFAMLVGGAIFLVLLCSRVPSFRFSELFKKAKRKWLSFAARIAMILLLCIPTTMYINVLFQPDLAEKTSLDNTLFTPKYMYKTNGFYVAFLMDLRLLQVDEPEGYSVQKAETLLAEQETDSTVPEVLPNIIVIMNEAFSDPSVLGEFDTNVDYMPNVSALLDGAENTVSGSLYSSVLGGNTANSEYEFLTGHTMAFLPNGSVAYQQYIHGETPSVASQLRELGYETYGMHPYNASGWNRNKVYPWLGFDSSLFYNDFKDKVKLRKYVDDQSDYANILRMLNETEEPVFIFNVTMQNHSGYGDKYENFRPEVQAQFKNTKSNTYLNNYLSLMKVSDQAIANLLNTLEDDDRPTLVVFFGDHQPNDYVVKPIYKEHGLDIENQTLEQQQKRQIVPFFIWANYDIEEQTDVSISINYLSSLLFDVADLPMSQYQSFLYQLYQQIPVINAVGYIDTEDTCKYLSDTDEATEELMNQYQMLQYYQMFDQ
ncbi:MAG: LTA synthase family protein [Lachnospiraceae bacterium]|nr:LTA synthase family protein [Lachnospiraceae bacterium]